MKKLFFVLRYTLCAIVACAEIQINGLNYEINNTTNTASVWYNGSFNNENLIIPPMITYGGKSYTVTEIIDYAFYNNQNITSVTIPNTILTIGANAFQHCDDLTSLSLGASIISIGDYCFEHCVYLQSLVCPNSLIKIGDYAFSNCVNLQSIDLGSVDSIGKQAFYVCRSLTTLNIPESVRYIGEEAFVACANLLSLSIDQASVTISKDAFNSCTGLQTIDFGDSVCSIGADAFKFCTSLKKVVLPNSIKKIKRGSFSWCSSLSAVFIPASVTSIEEFAFNECRKLVSVNIPSSLMSIGNGAFEACTALLFLDYNGNYGEDGIVHNGIDIPNGMSVISEHLFSDCYSISSVTLPQSVDSVKNWAFSFCTGLSSIYCYALIPPHCGEDCFIGVTKSSVNLYVPLESIDLYRTANEWKDFYIHPTLTSIETSTSISNTIQKSILNGQIIIRKNDIIYNMQGVQIK